MGLVIDKIFFTYKGFGLLVVENNWNNSSFILWWIRIMVLYKIFLINYRIEELYVVWGVDFFWVW